MSEWLGREHDIPVVATLEVALTLAPRTLLVGLTTAGGSIPSGWLPTLRDAVDQGLHIMSGLHEYIADDRQLAAAAAHHGVTITDHRRPPDRRTLATGRARRTGSRGVLTVGTDCSIGKMTAPLELRRASREAGMDALVAATGQTGIVIEG